MQSDEFLGEENAEQNDGGCGCRWLLPCCRRAHRPIRRPIYPDKPVKIVVSVPAGGGVDTVTRLFAARLQQRLGQPFVIENRGGAGGNIGAETVYTAEPDGYTLLASQPAPITSNVALYKKLNFDPVALEPVAVMSKFPNVLRCGRTFRPRPRRSSSPT